ncbi:hypothetical protein ACKS0A_09017 [Histoplasma ohiense]
MPADLVASTVMVSEVVRLGSFGVRSLVRERVYVSIIFPQYGNWRWDASTRRGTFRPSIVTKKLTRIFSGFTDIP